MKVKMNGVARNVLMCALVLGFVSCEKSEQGTSRGSSGGSSAKKGVYVAGYRQPSSSTRIPVLWVDGVATVLSHGEQAEAHDVCVSGNDVYVVGYSSMGTSRVAMIWINGLSIPLSFNYSSAHSITIVGDDKYIVGEDSYSNYISVATLWHITKDNQITSKRLNGNTSYAYSVATKGKDVYVAGSLSGSAIMWRNDDKNQTSLMSSGSTAYKASSISVNGQDTYIAGMGQPANSEKNVATYWKNSKAVNLTDGQKGESEAFSVCVSGSDVYVGGYHNLDFYDKTAFQRRAAIWKNDKPQYLTDGVEPAEVNSLTVKNGSVYAAGYHRFSKTYCVATIWVDGTATYLEPKNANSYALSVFVAN